jgi:Zn-dependent alcohol dehydrogenase
MEWPSTWTDRRDRDRTPSIPGHELAGVVTALGYGTTGLSVGQRVAKGSVKCIESDDFAAALGALPEAYSKGSTRDGDMV